MVEVASVVLFTNRAEAVVRFYRALGVPLEDEDHGDGLLHAACDIGDVHFAVVDTSGPEVTQPWRTPGSTFVGLWVDDLAAVLEAARAQGTDLLLPHQQCEWGCRVVLTDPDTRAVELNQRDHCR